MFRLPKGYPATTAPRFAIQDRSGWLTRLGQQRLLQELGAIAQQNLGDASLYACMQWLQDEAIKFLYGLPSQLCVFQPPTPKLVPHCQSDVGQDERKGDNDGSAMIRNEEGTKSASPVDLTLRRSSRFKGMRLQYHTASISTLPDATNLLSELTKGRGGKGLVDYSWAYRLSATVDQPVLERQGDGGLTGAGKRLTRCLQQYEIYDKLIVVSRGSSRANVTSSLVTDHILTQAKSVLAPLSPRTPSATSTPQATPSASPTSKLTASSTTSNGNSDDKAHPTNPTNSTLACTQDNTKDKGVLTGLRPAAILKKIRWDKTMEGEEYTVLYDKAGKQSDSTAAPSSVTLTALRQKRMVIPNHRLRAIVSTINGSMIWERKT